MKNLLSKPCSQGEMRDILARHLRKPLLPPLDDQEWEKVLRNSRLTGLLERMRERADREKRVSSPKLVGEIYAEYALTGSRQRFDGIYNRRRQRQTWMALALLAAVRGDRAEWTSLFLEGFEELLREPSWIHPAHVGLSNARRPAIDLLAAETADIIAVCLEVFSPIIPESLRRLAKERLRCELWENYRDNDFHWADMSNNWNAVCHQGVLGSALSLEDDVDLLAALLAKTSASLGRYLAGFENDGGCSEGPTYWDYGFGHFCLLNERLEVRSGGELSFFEGNDKIRAIASYGPALSLSAGRLANFSDANGQGVLSPHVLQYLGMRLGDASYLEQAAENYRMYLDGSFPVDAGRSEISQWLRLLFRCPMLDGSKRAKGRKDTYFPSLGLWVVRARDNAGHLWELAAKGGHNAESHNHNDLGNFLLNVDGRPLIFEIGAPSYERDYFGPGRYAFLAARTLGHSLPIINGSEQAQGREFFAQVADATIDRQNVHYEVDLTKAYPSAARCKRFSRRLTLDKLNGIFRWDDEFEFDGAGHFESALVADDCAQMRIKDKCTAYLRHGERELEIQCKNGGSWSHLEEHHYLDGSGQQKKIHRMMLCPIKANLETRVSCEIRLV